MPELQNKEQGAQSSPFDSEHRPLGGFVEVFDMCSTLLSPTWKWKGKRGKLHCGMSEQRTLRGGLLGSRKRRVGAHLILKGGGKMKIGAFVICLVYIFAGSVLLGRRGANTGHTLSLSMCRYRSSRKSEHQSSKWLSRTYLNIQEPSKDCFMQMCLYLSDSLIDAQSLKASNVNLPV